MRSRLSHSSTLTSWQICQLMHRRGFVAGDHIANCDVGTILHDAARVVAVSSSLFALLPSIERFSMWMPVTNSPLSSGNSVLAVGAADQRFRQALVD